jgi:hypothetical protein
LEPVAVSDREAVAVALPLDDEDTDADEEADAVTLLESDTEDVGVMDEEAVTEDDDELLGVGATYWYKRLIGAAFAGTRPAKKPTSTYS